MQVSWIEPEHLRDLVGQLQRPAGKANNVAWELHTLPNPVGLGARELGIDEGDLWLPEGHGATIGTASPVAPPVDQLFSTSVVANELQPEAVPPQFPGEPVPAPGVGNVNVAGGAEVSHENQQPRELDRIRERLQAIRMRAIEAGLLAHVGVTSESPTQEPEQAREEAAAELPPPPPEAVSAPPLLPAVSPFSLAEPAASDPAVAAPVVSAPAFEPPAGALVDRLNAFASWAGSELKLGDLLIVDDHGDVLWGFHEQAGLVVSAMMACKAAMRSSALGAAGLSNVIEQPIAAGRMLVIVPCQTGYGTLSIAFIREGGLPASDAQLLQRALAMTIETQAPATMDGSREGTSLD